MSFIPASSVVQEICPPIPWRNKTFDMPFVVGRGTLYSIEYDDDGPMTTLIAESCDDREGNGVRRRIVTFPSAAVRHLHYDAARDAVRVCSGCYNTMLIDVATGAVLETLLPAYDMIVAAGLLIARRTCDVVILPSLTLLPSGATAICAEPDSAVDSAIVYVALDAFSRQLGTLISHVHLFRVQADGERREVGQLESVACRALQLAALDGVLYVATSSGAIVVVDAINDAVLTRIETVGCGWSEEHLCIDDGVLYSANYWRHTVQRFTTLCRCYWQPDVAAHGACPRSFQQTIVAVLALASVDTVAAQWRRLPLELVCCVGSVLSRERR